MVHAWADTANEQLGQTPVPAMVHAWADTANEQLGQTTVPAMVHAWADIANEQLGQTPVGHWFTPGQTQQMTTRSNISKETGSRLCRHSKRQLGHMPVPTLIQTWADTARKK